MFSEEYIMRWGNSHQICEMKKSSVQNYMYCVCENL